MNEDRATRYQRLKRRAEVVSLVWSAALLAGLAWSGASVWLRSWSDAAAGGSPALTVLIYVVALMTINELLGLPIAVYSGLVLEKRYGLSAERLGMWLIDEAKAFAVGLLLAGGAASLVYFCIRFSPGGWWAPAGAAFAVGIVGVAHVAPVLLLPLFYSVKPLARESLRARLLALADRAGAKVLGVYEWGLAAKTRKANAALTGLGPTRRILVSDTMLAEYSDEEIEIVLAHELAHHVHGDIWKGLLFESLLIVMGFWVASQALTMLVAPLGFAGPADVAGLPVLMLAAGAVAIVMLPAAYALSRANERSADRFALRLTRNPAAFISAMQRLGAQNLAEDNPSTLTQWLFYSHPPIRERIVAARQSDA